MTFRVRFSALPSITSAQHLVPLGRRRRQLFRKLRTHEQRRSHDNG